MARHDFCTFAAAAVLLVPVCCPVLSVFSTPVLAQTSVSDDTTGELPADPRDLSGIWMNDNTLDERLKREGRHRLDPDEPVAERAVPLLTAEYELVRQQRQAARAHLAEGAEECKWPGMPQIMTYPYPFEILHTPGRITMIFEAESQVRRIFLNRSEHLPFEELDPSYNGDSIGRWEGNTLVIETVGFHDHTEIPGGYPHSEHMRIVERLRYIGPETIQLDMTITDPLAFREPFNQTIIYSKRPDWRIREYSCMENNRDAPNAAGERSGGVVEQ